MSRRSFVAAAASCVTWLTTRTAFASVLPASYSVRSFGATATEPRSTPTPAHSFYLRHAQQIELRHILVEPGSPEPRPLVWMDDVRNCQFDDVRSTDPASATITGIHTEAIEIVQPFSTPPQKN